jgi:hypothetical protein
MKKAYLLLIMAAGIISCGCLSSPPKGDLIYCSYSRNGAAGLGKDYCELIADVDSVPKVVVVMDEDNRFGDPVIHRSYQVDKSVVDSLSKLLSENKVYKLNGYHLDEAICGGYSYRIYQEYSSGDKVNAFWYGHGVKDSALTAYAIIENFFTPWRERAVQEEKTEILVKRISEMEQLYERVSKATRKRKTYPEFRDDVNKLRGYMDSGQWKEDYEADEKGEIPKDLKRGVLSQDGLYNLLQSDRLFKLMCK